MISRTQIDKLGDRLRIGDVAEEDLRSLDEYRRSFSDAYEFVIGAIRDQLKLHPTGRPAKSTRSIIEKLLRESVRLTQIQDIAGCRIVLDGIVEQDRVMNELTRIFSRAEVVDRRVQPSFGYRAVHVIIKYEEKSIEVQVRTLLQHIWAELSEKMSDVFDPAIKYGSGHEGLRELLSIWSGVVKKEEEIEYNLYGTRSRVDRLIRLPERSAEDKLELVDLQASIARQIANQADRRESNLKAMQEAIEDFERFRGNL